MSRQPHYFAIGLFILVSIALVTAGVIVLGGNALSSPKYFFETYLDESIQGVDVGTPFKFRGVKVGNISHISLVSAEYDTKKMYVLLRVALDEAAVDEAKDLCDKIAGLVYDGLRVKLTPMGITGLSFLEADYYAETSDPLTIDWTPKYPYIPATPALMTKVGQSIDRLAAQLDQINLDVIAGNIEQISSNINVAVATDFMPLMENLEARMLSTASTFENLDKTMQAVADEAPQIIENARLASEKLPEIGTNLNAAVSDLQLLIEGNSGEVEEIIENVRRITDEAKELVRMLKKHPGMLLAKPPEEITE